MVRQDGGRPGLRSAGGRKKHEGVSTQKALCMNKGSRKTGARREHYTFRQSREGASRARGSLTRPDGTAKEMERSLVSTRKRGGGRCNLSPQGGVSFLLYIEFVDNR